MNASTIIAIVILLVLLVIAIRYIYKNGTCAGCPDKVGCSGTCESKKLLKEFKDEPDFKEKNEKIEEIMKKHRV